MIRVFKVDPDSFLYFRHPVEYHNNHAGVNLYQLAFRTYILPVLVSSVIFCIPKWLELTINEHVTFSNITLDNGTNLVRKCPIIA